MAIRPPGVLFIPAHVIPLIHPRSVAVIHDLGYLHVPEAHAASTRWMLDLTTRWNARVARKIIAISDATKRDLIAAYETPEGKIVVVPHGVSSTFRPRSASETAETLNRLGVQRPYVLTVGTYQPRKNFGRLARAMAWVASAGLPHELVIAGKRGWLANQVDHDIAASGQTQRVRRLGYVAAADLPALHAGASAFCLLSLYEGFGMPVLEAMASGVPTVTSNTPALVEVAAHAAVMVDPMDPDAIGAALVRVLADASFTEELRAAGLKRAAEFTWSRTARATLDVLRQVRDA